VETWHVISFPLQTTSLGTNYERHRPQSDKHSAKQDRQAAINIYKEKERKEGRKEVPSSCAVNHDYPCLLEDQPKHLPTS
jgi:hypothetical protein